MNDTLTSQAKAGVRRIRDAVPYSVSIRGTFFSSAPTIVPIQYTEPRQPAGV